MTITFSFLKKYNNKLTNEKIIETLLEFDKQFFNTWIRFNRKMNPKTPIDYYIIDLPVTIIDDIGKKLRNVS